MPDEPRAKKPPSPNVRGPLGIIGSFLTLIYALAVTAVWLSRESGADTSPLIWFIVVFPILVLGVFTWLVVRHTAKLYSPSEFGEHKPSWLDTDGLSSGTPAPKKRPPRTRATKRTRKPKPGSERPEEPKP